MKTKYKAYLQLNSKMSWIWELSWSLTIPFDFLTLSFCHFVHHKDVTKIAFHWDTQSGSFWTRIVWSFCWNEFSWPKIANLCHLTGLQLVRNFCMKVLKQFWFRQELKEQHASCHFSTWLLTLGMPSKKCNICYIASDFLKKLDHFWGTHPCNICYIFIFMASLMKNWEYVTIFLACTLSGRSKVYNTSSRYWNCKKLNLLNLNCPCYFSIFVSLIS